MLTQQPKPSIITRIEAKASLRASFNWEKIVYNLSNFKPFDGIADSGQMKVLVWTQSQGYFFTEYGFIQDLENTKIIAKEK